MGVGQVAIKRGINAIFLICLVTIINFFLFRVMPGDPIAMMTSPSITAEVRAILLQKFGLDKPLHIQFIKYIEQLLQGNLGMSFVYQRPVVDLIAERLPNTVLLLLSSYIITVILSIVLGLVAAWKRGGKIDISLIIFSLWMHSMPIFWLGGLLLLFFSIQLNIFPVIGISTPWLEHENTLSYIADVAYHLFLPMMTLGIGNIGGMFLITRNSLLDVFSEDYIVTAKAIGLSSRTILFRNVLRNAMLPLATVILMRLGFIIGGAVTTETVFSWPGVGLLIYRAVMHEDYPLLQGAFLIITISAVLANYVAEIVYGYLDPRVRYE
jgi:peptide/nickel transport system permease protein